MSTDKAQTDWHRSTLPLLLLRALSAGPAHGYALIDILTRWGFEVKGAAVYPHLARLQEEGFITSEWHAPESGPARKILTITPRGDERLDELRQHWIRFRDLVDAAIPSTDTGGDA